MSDQLIVRPRLSERIAASESRTSAFGARHFGPSALGAAVDLALPHAPDPAQSLLAEVLLVLLLRMDPVVTEIRLPRMELSLRLLEDARNYVPLEVTARPDQSLPVVDFAVGYAERNFVDASDWHTGFDAMVPASKGNSPAGAFLGALEAAKYLYLRGVQATRSTPLEQQVWSTGGVFDAWNWSWEPRPLSVPKVHGDDLQADVALVGCGGVGAAFLWFLRNTGLKGRLLLIDGDFIEWHNMNRLPFATIADADSGSKKVVAASVYMSPHWDVRALAHPAEHPKAMVALAQAAAGGSCLISAVGEVEPRRRLAKRGFARLLDGATNSDGSAQLLALEAGASSCVECRFVERVVGSVVGGCGNVQLQRFAGVVPHLAAYAGFLLGIEHFRAHLGAPPLAGVNTQSILLPLDDATRFDTGPCVTCPSGPGAVP